jgi:aryl-alcohol dehydrogenase-like predicted oxidoreductase
MNLRVLGRTGLRISDISFGAWGIGGNLWQGSDDRESVRALHRAADLGVNFVDTALVYGNGHSEKLVGAFVKERKERIYIATKIPPKNGRWPANHGSRLADVFPSAHIVNATEASLRNLGVERIDVQQFHVWNDDWTDLPEWYDALTRLKSEGKIRSFGISINDHQPANALRLIESGKCDTVQVIYNIFDQVPERELFPACKQRNIGVIVRVPFDEGALTGSITPGSTFPDGDFRRSYFRGNRTLMVAEHVNKLLPLLGNEAATLPELALRFCLHHDAVSTVIPGMRTVPHVESNCAISDGRRLGEQMLGTLRNHAWDKNFYA